MAQPARDHGSRGSWVKRDGRPPARTIPRLPRARWRGHSLLVRVVRLWRTRAPRTFTEKVRYWTAKLSGRGPNEEWAHSQIRPRIIVEEKPCSCVPGVLHRAMRHPRLFRWALRLDIAHVSVFLARALASGTQVNSDARAARADAAVAAAGLSLAVAALHRDARTPVIAGLVLNTTGCIVTFRFLARDMTHARRAPWWWTAYLLAGGNAVSVAYLLAAGQTLPRQAVR